MTTSDVRIITYNECILFLRETLSLIATPKILARYFVADGMSYLFFNGAHTNCVADTTSRSMTLYIACFLSVQAVSVFKHSRGKDQ